MAEPCEPRSESGTEEVERLVARAQEVLGAGGRLPAPTTWNELLVGIVVWLNTKWTVNGRRPPCENCGKNDWEVGPVVSLEASERWPIPEGRSYGSFPFFQLGCKECGNTLFVDALRIFEPQAPATPPS